MDDQDIDNLSSIDLKILGHTVISACFEPESIYDQYPKTWIPACHAVALADLSQLTPYLN
jgi:hypothetical protein